MIETPRSGFCNAELKGDSMKFYRGSVLLQIVPQIDCSGIFTKELVN